MASNNYNSIAVFYDLMSRIIFQKSIINAQVFLLKHIKPNSKILMVGGGTGWVLQELSKIYSKGIEITYVEKSRQMISLSQQKNVAQNTVEFVNKSMEDFSTEKKFDVVLTAFFFDNFQPPKTQSIFSILDHYLYKNGIWLYADFTINQHSKWWQKLLLKIMYLFFRITTNIETNRLPNVSKCFETKYKIMHEKLFYNQFIKATVYKKL